GHRQALRAGGGAQRLHNDPVAGAADRRVLHTDQFRDRPHVRVARSADPVSLMSAVPGTFEITYKVPRRRHPVLAFAIQQPLGTAGLIIILLMIFAAVFANWVAPYDPLAVDYGGILAPPSWKHLLGTDNFGRDVFSRIIHGSQTALAVGSLSSLSGCTLGAVIGVASAYYGGRRDMVV